MLVNFLRQKRGFNNETVPPVVPPVPPAVPPVAPPPAPNPHAFTPEQQKIVNDQIAVERRKGEEKNQQIIAQLEILKKSKSTSEEQAKAYDQQIETLRTEYMTKEQLAQDNFKKKEAEFSSGLKVASDERDHWKSTFQKTLAKTEILKAATSKEAEAYSPDQMLEFLSPKAKVTEIIDQATGKGTGEYVVKIPLTVTDDKGVSKTLELTPLEALVKMQDMPAYQNLFKSKIKGGLGGTNSGPVGAVDFNDAVNDPTKWKEARKKLGLG